MTTLPHVATPTMNSRAGVLIPPGGLPHVVSSLQEEDPRDVHCPSGVDTSAVAEQHSAGSRADREWKLTTSPNRVTDQPDERGCELFSHAYRAASRSRADMPKTTKKTRPAPGRRGRIIAGNIARINRERSLELGVPLETTWNPSSRHSTACPE